MSLATGLRLLGLAFVILTAVAGPLLAAWILRVLGHRHSVPMYKCIAILAAPISYFVPTSIYFASYLSELQAAGRYLCGAQSAFVFFIVVGGSMFHLLFALPVVLSSDNA